MRRNFDQFVAAVAFLLVLPLFSLLGEFMKTRDLREDTLTICMAFYCFCLTASTNSLLKFTLCFILGIVESLKYNGPTARSALPIYSTMEFYVFPVVFMVHITERFRRHYLKAEIFLTFF